MAAIPVYILIGQSNASKEEMDGFLLSQIADRGPDFELVKLVVGSTAYADNPDFEDWNVHTGELYDDLVADVQERVAYIESQGNTAQIATLFSIHGESDAFNYTFSTQFEANIREFIASLASDLNAPGMEFVFSTIHPDYPRAGADNVRQALFDIAADTENFHAVDTADLILMIVNGEPDLGGHYDLASRHVLADMLLDASTPRTHADNGYVSISSSPLTSGTDGSDTITTDFYADVIYGYRGDDTINAGGGENHVVAGAGNDDIVTGVNDDLIKGGDGADQIFSGSEEALDAANVNAPIDNDIIFGQGGNDFIVSYTGDDYLDGGPGNDVIYSYAGNDVIRGGSGNDKLFDELYSDTSILTNISDRIDGGSGDDYIRAFFGRDMIEGGDGDDRIVTGDASKPFVGDADSDRIDGGAGRDQITVHDGNNKIFGGSGHDTINVASEGDNEIYAGDGHDTIYLGSGANYVEGGIGNDTVYDSNGDEVVWTNSGIDYVRDAGGDDFYHLGRGDDRITFGAGDDTVWGQSGADVFIFDSRSTGHKTIADYDHDDRLLFDSSLRNHFEGVTQLDDDDQGMQIYKVDFTYGMSVEVHTATEFSMSDILWA